METKPQVGAGDIAITLDGAPAVLKPTLECCQTLSRTSGGLYGPGSISERLSRYDFDVYPLIIRAGLGLGAGAVKELDGQVYAAGMLKLIGPLSKFIANVANGGMPPSEGSDKDGSGKGKPEGE